MVYKLYYCIMSNYECLIDLTRIVADQPRREEIIKIQTELQRQRTDLDNILVSYTMIKMLLIYAYM